MIRIPQALDLILARFAKAIFVSSCGYVSRDLLARGERARNLYLVGSMGMAGPIGAGLAHARPDLDVVAIDGDGSWAMNPGAMLMISHVTSRIVHIILDDGVHASTGGQATTRPAEPAAFALSAGYKAAHQFTETGDLTTAAEPGPGATLWHLTCARRDYQIGARLTTHPRDLVAIIRGDLGAPPLLGADRRSELSKPTSKN